MKPSEMQQGSCVCLGERANNALMKLRDAIHTDRLVDDSHFGVSLIRCNGCGQRFLRIFTELIDWDDGDDSQACLYMPIDEDEAKRLRALGTSVTEEYLLGLYLKRRYLLWSHPRGDDAGVLWIDAELVILPHD